MTYQLWSQVMTEDARRQATKVRLIRIASQPRKIQNRQRIAKLACRIGLTKTC